jgi:hypothetical protein
MGIPSEAFLASVSYDPDTGVFTRTDGDKHVRGKPTGTDRGDGYIVIRIRGEKCAAHRLAWYFTSGEWPADEVDHVNGNASDNRAANLRPATHAQNAANRRGRGKRKKGVSFDRRQKRFIAQIGVRGRNRFLGRFSTEDEAHDAYRQAAIEAFGAFARFQ